MAIMPDDEPIGTHPSDNPNPPDDSFPWDEDAAPVPVVRDDAALVAEVDEVF